MIISGKRENLKANCDVGISRLFASTDELGALKRPILFRTTLASTPARGGTLKHLKL
jgi:hypothetical protein